MSLTLSAGVGAEVSRPRSNSSAASQEREERPQARVTVEVGERRRMVEERHEAVGASALDVDAGRGQHASQQVEQWLAEMATKVGQLGGEPGEAGPGLC